MLATLSLDSPPVKAETIAVRTQFAKATPELLADPDLTPSEKLVLLALAFRDWQVDEYARSHFTNEELARAVNLRPRAVQGILNGLAVKGRITVRPDPTWWKRKHTNHSRRIIDRVRPPSNPEALTTQPSAPSDQVDRAPECALNRAPDRALKPVDRAPDRALSLNRLEDRKRTVDETVDAILAPPGLEAEETEVEVATVEVPTSQAGVPAHRRAQAARLLKRLRLERHKRVVLDGSRVIVQHDAGTEGEIDLTDEDRRDIKDLKAEVIAELGGRPGPSEALPAQASVAEDQIAPPVSQAARAELIKRVTQAAVSADEETALEAATKMVRVFRDADEARSKGFYLSVIRQTREGLIPQDWLVTAVEQALRPKKRCRGAVFTDALDRLKRESRRAS